MKKRCSRCKWLKSKTEFYPDKGKKDGLSYNCKVCKCEVSRLRYRTKVLEFRQYARSTERRFGVSKWKAKDKKVGWSLSLKQYASLITQSCHYCKDLLGKNLTGIGLDRIDNKKGYHKKNVLPCCGECNRIRSDSFTVDETKVMIQALINFRN